MQIVAERGARATGAEVVVARVADDARRSLNACAVATSSAAVGAELEGSRLPLEDVPDYEVGDAGAICPRVCGGRPSEYELRRCC